MKIDVPFSRRHFIQVTTAAGGGLWAGLGMTGTTLAAESEARVSAGVTPAEDLMFEHGLIERMLFIYQKAAEQIEYNEEIPFEAIRKTADLTRRFTEDYHEKNEERSVFPLFEKIDNPYRDLVKTLKQQHDAGRKVTDIIMQQSRQKNLSDPQQLARTMRSFVRMYGPHAARENSVLFRAFQSTLPANEYRDLGEEFEAKEEDIFGKDGFWMVLTQVAEIEKSLGIYDLNQFTPSV